MKYFIALLLVFHSLISFGQINPRYFSYERTPCFGKCETYQVEVLSNGKITYTGKKNVEKLGTYEAKLSSKQLKQILSAFVKYKLPIKSNKYKKLASDLPSLNYWYEIKKKRYTQMNVSDSPNKLKQIAAIIDSILPKLKWKMTMHRMIEEPEAQIAMVELPPPAIETQENKVFTKVDVMPQYPGGDSSRAKFINLHLVYPPEALENGIQGKVICSYVIDKDGNVEDVKVFRSLGYGCDKEAVRVLQSMPKHIPGILNGKNVKVGFNIPISFKLEGE